MSAVDQLPWTGVLAPRDAGDGIRYQPDVRLTLLGQVPILAPHPDMTGPVGLLDEVGTVTRVWVDGPVIRGAGTLHLNWCQQITAGRYGPRLWLATHAAYRAPRRLIDRLRRRHPPLLVDAASVHAVTLVDRPHPQARIVVTDPLGRAAVEGRRR